MRMMRHILPGLALAFSVNLAALADTPPEAAPPTAGGHAWHGGHHGHGGYHHLLSKLNLSADQKAQVKSIYAQSKPRFQALMASSRANHEALSTTAPSNHPAYDTLLETAKQNSASMVQLHSDVWAQIHAVLTPEQQAAIPGIVAAEKAQRDARRAAWQQAHSQS